MAAADGANLMAPVIILAVALLGGLILAVAIVDLRRKRQAQAVAIEGQIADALMREPRLTGAVITTVAHVPLAARAAPTVEIRGAGRVPRASRDRGADRPPGAAPASPGRARRGPDLRLASGAGFCR